jgi:hypothetical protein
MAYRRERELDPPASFRGKNDLEPGYAECYDEAERRDAAERRGRPGDVDAGEGQDDEHETDRDAGQAPQATEPRRRRRRGSRHEGSGRKHDCITV